MNKLSFTQKGEGLVEILITAVIIIISVVSLMRFQSTIAYNSSFQQQQAIAISLAQKQIETLRDFQVLNTTSSYFAYQDISSNTVTTNSVDTTYTLTSTVTTSTSPSYKTINVVVSWTDRRSVNQSLSLLTYVAGINPASSATIMY